MGDTEAGEGRLVGAALRCYPPRWRRRHADEAAELATLLIGDGTPAAAIAWSYLGGAVREWLTPRPGRPLSAVGAALLAVTCLFGFSAALIAETVPARAASVTHPSPGPTPPKSEPASCRPVPPRQTARVTPAHGVAPAAGDQRRNTEGAAGARSC